MKTSVNCVIRLLWCSLVAATASALVSTSAFGQAILTSWEGLSGPDGSVPPDVHGAPGPAGVVATVNLEITYFTKSGGTIWGPVQLQTFWSSAGNTGNGLSDPKVIFDPDSQRFFVIMQENTGSQFWLNLAVSRSSDPRTSTAADWIWYRLDGTEYTAGTNSSGGYNYGGDYPGLAVDSQALYVVHRMWTFFPDGTLHSPGSSFYNCGLKIMNKSALISGSGALSVVYIGDFTQQPVTPFGGSPGNVMYLVATPDSSHIAIYGVTDPLGAQTVNQQSFSVTDYGGGNDNTNGAPQLGSSSQIPPILGVTLDNASLVKGDVWFCCTRAGPNPTGPSVASYYRLRLNGWPASGSVSLVEDSTVGNGSYWNFCPAIGVNQAGDVAMTWTRSSPATYPTMMYAYRNASDSGFGAPQVVKASQTANNDGRWGDYATVWPDPIDGSLWIANEWTRADTGTWSTWWAQIATPAQDFYVNWNAPFPLIQDGSLSFPYTTVGAAHANITHGTIHIYGGKNYNEQFTLYKAVLLQLYSGSPFTIGKP